MPKISQIILTKWTQKSQIMWRRKRPKVKENGNLLNPDTTDLTKDTGQKG